MSVLTLQTFCAILLVFGLIFSLYILAQRFGPRWAGSGRRRMVRVVEATPLGDKRNLLVVDVQGRRYLLGSTHQSITLLTDVDSRETDSRRKKPLSSVETPERARIKEVEFTEVLEATR